MMWRCFHCNAQFRSYPKAAEHFGTSEHQQPACLIDIAEYRRMEAVHKSYAEAHRIAEQVWAKVKEESQ